VPFLEPIGIFHINENGVKCSVLVYSRRNRASDGAWRYMVTSFVVRAGLPHRDDFAEAPLVRALIQRRRQAISGAALSFRLPPLSFVQGIPVGDNRLSLVMTAPPGIRRAATGAPSASSRRMSRAAARCAARRSSGAPRWRRNAGCCWRSDRSLADLFPPTVMDEYAATADVSATEASALVAGGWTASPPLAVRGNHMHWWLRRRPSRLRRRRGRLWGSRHRRWSRPWGDHLGLLATCFLGQADRFYGLEKSAETITLVKEMQTVPLTIALGEFDPDRMVRPGGAVGAAARGRPGRVEHPEINQKYG
jgi:hypothetical protein